MTFLKTFKFISLSVLFWFNTEDIQAHPTGNMIVFKDHILWSYVYPLNDPSHHACVMIWDKKSKPREFIVSEYASSDWMLYGSENDLYLLERRYISSEETFEIRILKTDLSEKPVEIWPWMKDTWRIGEGGYWMESDSSMVFCSHPGIYRISRNEQPTVFLDLRTPIIKMHPLRDGKILTISESGCSLITKNGRIIQKWNSLLKDGPEDPPLNRNQIFDADYRNGKLLIAYWGNRSFEMITEKEGRIVIKKLSSPWASHWVTFDDNVMYLFASSIEAGKNPRPRLLKYDGHFTEVWTEKYINE
jgi:hypothetical protein